MTHSIICMAYNVLEKLYLGEKMPGRIAWNCYPAIIIVIIPAIFRYCVAG